MFRKTEAKNKSGGGKPAETTKEKGNHRLFNTVLHYGLKDLCHGDTFHSFTAKLERKIKCQRQDTWDY